MEMTDLLTPGSVINGLRVTSKKQVLQDLSERSAALTGLAARDILDTMLARERLGTTGVGQGIAIPHGRMDSLDRIYGLLRLKSEPRMTRFLARELSTAHWFDISAAKNDFDYHPEVTIEEGLKRLAHHLQNTGEITDEKP